MEALQLLRRNRDYSWYLLADVINSIGASFTSVLMYYSLDKFDAPAWWFTFAYLAFIIPSYFGSLLAEKFGKRFDLAKANIGANIFCLFALTLTIYGFLNQNLMFLVVSEVAVSFAMGFIGPFSAFYLNKRFNKQEIAHIPMIDTIVFGIQGVLGFALGSWFITRFSPNVLFTTDALTYIVSSLIILMLVKSKAKNLQTKPKFLKLKSFKSISREQRRLFWLIPLISIMGMPIMSLGPVLTSQVNTSNIAMSGVLIFMLARTTGQFLGPLVTKFFHFDKLVAFKGLLPICSLMYFIFYYLASVSTTIYNMIGLIIVAHLFSNIASMTAFYALLGSFDENDGMSVESVSAKQSQYATILGSLSAVAGTIVLTQFGAQSLFIYVIIIWAGILLMTFRS